MSGRQQGLTLIELLVAMLILSILAAAVLPYAEVTVQRERELELRRGLRTIRTAIDRFHEDWQNGRIPKTDDPASDDGYPKSLRVLVNGVRQPGSAEKRTTYLRRVPRDPLADPAVPTEEQWALRGYQDEPDTATWGGKDVYDVHSRSDKVAIDGTRYRDW